MSHSCTTKEPKNSARAVIVNNLERVYGPVLVVLLYTFFFVGTDGAKEAILGYLNEIETLFGGQNGSAPNDPVLIRVVSTTVLMFLVPVAGYSLTAWILRVCVGENKWVWPFLVGVPFVTLLGFAGGFIIARLSGEFTGSDWVLLAPLAAGLVILRFALYVLVKDAEGDEELRIRRWVQKGEAALTDWFEQTPAPIRWTWRIWVSIGKTQVKTDTRDKIEEVTPYILGLAVLVIMCAPYTAIYLGPLGIAALAAIVIMSVLAHLTVLSHRYMPGNFPLILALIAMGAAAMSWGAALVLFGACLGLFWYLSSPRKLSRPADAVATNMEQPVSGHDAAEKVKDPKDWNRRNLIGQCVCVGFAGLFAVYVFLDRPYEICGSWTDCNLQRGERLQVTFTDLNAAVSEFDDVMSKTPVARPDAPAPSGGTEGNPQQTAVPPKKLRVVAAQGGGLYAAYHAAYYLALRADTEPGFAESVFAVSGISGGSVGAGVYWAIRKSGLCKDSKERNCHVRAVQSVLRRDYLSPALAGLLIRDNLDSVLPFTALMSEPVDRGHVMEDMLAKFVAELAEEMSDGDAKTPKVSDTKDALDGILDRTMGESPDFNKGAPILLLNTNWADTGENWVASPLREYADGHSGRILTNEGRDLTMRNALVNSARFPFVTPPGRVRVRMAERCYKEKDKAGNLVYDKACMAREQIENEARDQFKTDLRFRPADLRDCKDPIEPCMFKPAIHVAQLVDGGYFDSSGVETVMTLLPALQKELDNPNKEGEPKQEYEIEVLVLTSAGRAKEPTIKGFVGAPASAFLGAWGTRSDHSIEALKNHLARVNELGCRRKQANEDQKPETKQKCVDQNGEPTQKTVFAIENRIRPDTFNYTLSWYLTPGTFDDIEKLVEAEFCRALKEEGGTKHENPKITAICVPQSSLDG